MARGLQEQQGTVSLQEREEEGGGCGMSRVPV